MAGTPLTDTIRAWTQRINTAQKLGISPQDYKSVIQSDINKVKQGGTGIPNDQAYAAIIAAARGKSVVDPNKPRDWNPFAHVASDVGNIVRGALNPINLAKLVGHEAVGAEHLLTGQINPFKDAHNPGQALQGLAHTPVFDLIPGLHTVADVASGKSGLQDIVHHPVGSLLDVLPLAMEGGKLATAGIEDVTKGSALEAIQQGNPIKAGYRALPATFRDQIHEFAMNHQMAPELVNVATRPLQEANKVLAGTVHRYLQDEVMPIFGRKITEGENTLISEAMRGVTPWDKALSGWTDAERAVMIPKLKLLSEKLKSDFVNSARAQGKTVLHGSEVYAIDSPVERAYNAMQKAEAKYQEKLHTAKNPATVQRAEVALTESKANYEQALKTTPPIRTIDLAQHAIKSDVAKIVKDSGIPEHLQIPLDVALSDIANPTSIKDLTKFVTPEQWTTIVKDASDWQSTLSKYGADPMFIPNVESASLEDVLYPKILPDKITTPDTLHRNLLDFTPVFSDFAVSMTEGAVQLLREEAGRQFLTKFIKSGQLISEDNLLSSLKQDFAKAPNTNTLAVEELKKNYRKYPVPSELKSLLPDPKATYYMDARIYKAMESTIGQHAGMDIPFRGAYDKSLHAYKSFVLTTPRHLFHVGLGGSMFMALQYPTAFIHLFDAWGKLKAGELDPRLTMGVDNIRADEVGQFVVGKKFGGLLAQAAGSTRDAMNKAENLMADMQRAMVFETEHSSQLAGGASEAMAHEAGVQASLKVFMDLNGMTPFERTILKQVFPFYQFTRQLFRYLFTYPVDHPVRAAILTHFGEQANEEWDTGLPQKLQSLLFFGSPDHNGSRWNIDTKTFNPFRSFSSDFSLAGFYSSLNPFATATLQAAGVNTLSGTPELYPNMSYDPVSGTLTAKVDHNIPSLIANFIPEVAAIDHFIGLSSSLRRLRTSNPDAYRRQLFTALGIPLVPQKVNLPTIRASTEINKFKDAQMVVTKAFKLGKPELLDKYAVVPFNGQLVDARQLQALITQLAPQAKKSGVSVKAITSKSKKQPLPTVPTPTA